jgi:hypothetical protein
MRFSFFVYYLDRIYGILQPQLNKKPERFHGVKMFIIYFHNFPDESDEE